MYSIKRHTGAIHSLHQIFYPYANPYENIYEIEDKKMNKYIYQVFHNEWRDNLEKSSKGECYRSFKTQMKFESNLDRPNRSERVILSKLRISDHKLSDSK